MLTIARGDARRPRPGGGSRASRSRTSCRSRASRCRRARSASPLTARPVSRPSSERAGDVDRERAEGKSRPARAAISAVEQEPPARAEPAEQRDADPDPALTRSPASAHERGGDPDRDVSGGDARERRSRRPARSGRVDDLEDLDLHRREGRVGAAEAGAEQRTAVGRLRQALLQAGGEVGRARTSR